MSYRSAYLTVLRPEDEDDAPPDGAVAMETLSGADSRPFVLPSVVGAAGLGFATLVAVVGVAACRCRYRKEKIAALRTSMVVAKKVVLEKREREVRNYLEFCMCSKQTISCYISGCVDLPLPSA